MSKPGYRTRCIQHSLLWVNGIPKHNHIDDECVADFSCCEPSLFTEDLEKRMKLHQRMLDNDKLLRERDREREQSAES